ncbi:MAG: dGTP triphosphohydrolase [Candidatus Peregrinibacteria bacterium]
MMNLQERLQKANTLLAPYAVPHEGTLGREVQESEDETRFPFQRDRDRIIHTQAFRRLKGKTQVFVAGLRQGYGRQAGGGDHVRTRLTHTLEVAQISRDIARTLGLNEDLAECIALAHDLGHPPFGHAGEEALDAWMQTQGLRFEHNEQSLRIVTLLEEHASRAPGLNLNREILEGLKKHLTPHDEPEASATGHIPTLEGQVVNLADEIAYTAHDCDDGLSAKLFTFDELTVLPLTKQAAAQSAARGTSLRGTLIHLLVTDLYTATEQELKTHAIRTQKDVSAAPTSLVRFSDAMQQELKGLHDFLWQHLYLHPQVQACNTHGQSIVTALCRHYAEHPTDKILSLAKKTQGSLPEAIKDYVSGMTDAYALAQAQEQKLTADLDPPLADGARPTEQLFGQAEL